MTILTRLRHAAEQCRYWRRRRQISQYSTTNALFSGTSVVVRPDAGGELPDLLLAHQVDGSRPLLHLGHPEQPASIKLMKISSYSDEVITPFLLRTH